MPTLQIRLDDETMERIRQLGGSPWARERLVQSLGEKTQEPAGAGLAAVLAPAALLAWLDSA